MIEALVTLILVVLLVYVLFWALGRLALPEPIRVVVLVIVAIVVLMMVYRSGLLGGLL